MEHRIKIQKTARYFTRGENITDADYIWFVLHGYGQLAQYFIRKFSALDPLRHFVVAPEGLHRFYLQGSSGRVGASWMTKEARLDDIDDYVNYLNEVYDAVRIQNPSAKVVGFGFSQGVATLMRWMAMGGKPFDAGVMWAGAYPPELAPVHSHPSMKNTALFAAVGDEDPFVTEENVQREKTQHEAWKVPVRWITFKGGHTIPPQPLKELAEAIEGTLGGNSDR